MTNQLVVVTKTVEGKPPEKMAILVNNIFQIRPVFTDMPAIPAAPAIPTARQECSQTALCKTQGKCEGA